MLNATRSTRARTELDGQLSVAGSEERGAPYRFDVVDPELLEQLCGVHASGTDDGGMLTEDSKSADRALRQIERSVVGGLGADAHDCDRHPKLLDDLAHGGQVEVRADIVRAPNDQVVNLG